MIRRFLGIFQPQIVPRPRRGGFHRLAVRTCSITAHSAPVMFHTLKNNNPSFDRRRLSRRRSSLPPSPPSPLLFDEKSTIYLFIYLPGREGELPRQKATTRPIHRPCLPQSRMDQKIDPLYPLNNFNFAVEIVWEGRGEAQGSFSRGTKDIRQMSWQKKKKTRQFFSKRDVKNVGKRSPLKIKQQWFYFLYEAVKRLYSNSNRKLINQLSFLDSINQLNLLTRKRWRLEEKKKVSVPIYLAG